MREQLILASDAFCAATGMSRGRLSTLALGAGHRLDSIAAGGDLGTRTCEAAMLWLATNWPEGVAWPEGADRPMAAPAANADGLAEAGE